MRTNIKITGTRSIYSQSESIQKKFKNYFKNLDKEDAKIYDNIVQNGNYNVTVQETIHDNAKLRIAIMMLNIFGGIIDMIIKYKKSNISIIGIGDSPSIFLQVLEQCLKEKNLLPNLKFKNFPISSLMFIHNDDKTMKIAKEKMEVLNKEDVINNSDLIFWVDYVSSGNSFFNFMDIIPKEIIKKSKFFIYGDDGIKFHPRFKKDIEKNSKVKYYELIKYSVESQFVSTTIGKSEFFYMRCLERKEMNENFKLEIVDNEELPHEKSIYGKHCKKYAKYLYELFISAGFDNVLEDIVKVKKLKN